MQENGLDSTHLTPEVLEQVVKQHGSCVAGDEKGDEWIP